MLGGLTVQAFDAYVVYPLPYALILKWFLSGMVSFVVMGAVLAAVYRPAG